MKKIVLLLLTVATLGFSCSKDDEGASSNESVKVKIIPQYLTIDRHPPIDTVINILCESDWKIENVPDWCSFERLEGHGNSRVKVSIEGNGTEKNRKADIRINDEKLTISQAWKGIKNGSLIAKLMLRDGNCSLDIIRHLMGAYIPQPDRRYILNSGTVSPSAPYDMVFYDKGDEYTIIKDIRVYSVYDRQYTGLTIKLIYDSVEGYDKKYVYEHFGNPRQILISGGPDADDLSSNNLPQVGVGIEKVSNSVYKFSFDNYFVNTGNTGVGQADYYIVNGVLLFDVESL